MNLTYKVLKIIASLNKYALYFDSEKSETKVYMVGGIEFQTAKGVFLKTFFRDVDCGRLLLEEWGC